MRYELLALPLLLLATITFGCESDEGLEDDASMNREEQIEKTGTPTDRAAESSEPPERFDKEYRNAADLVRQHYTAISRRSYRRAYDLWAKGKREFNEFTTEAEKIERAVVSFERSGRAGTLDGSLVVEVPVTVEQKSSDARSF